MLYGLDCAPGMIRFYFLFVAGGVFGVGWLRDMVRLRYYVDEVNLTKQYVEEIKVRMKWYKK